MLQARTLQAPYGYARGLSDVWDQLTENSYVCVTDTSLGLPPELKSHLCRRFFSSAVLEGDHPAVHKDRDRARDVIRYRWSDNSLVLQEHNEIDIRNRSGFPGTRSVARVRLLNNPMMTTWINRVLTLVPPHDRQLEGTFGVNFLRTRTTVVSGPHQDDEEYVVVYVCGKHGEGAESFLHDINDPGRIVFKAVLNPGDLLIFKDAAFLHNVSPLQPAQDSQPTHRNALVCTVNYRGTYSLDQR